METFNLPPEIETLLTTLFAENKCACHVINPNKTRILMWKKVKDHQVTYYLKIGIQKFASQAQTDRNGEVYWRYWTYEPKPDERTSEANFQTDSPLTKYQQRIAKTEVLTHAKSVPNSSQATESTSH